jgi:hypothetical protein
VGHRFDNETDFEKTLKILTLKNWIYETDSSSTFYQINEQMTKTENYKIELDDYKVFNNGSDSGHYYLKTKIIYKGKERDLIVFFFEKSDEKKIKSNEKLIIEGDLMDEGNEFSLTLYNSIIKSYVQ